MSLSDLPSLIKAKKAIGKHVKANNTTADFWDGVWRKNADKPCLTYADEDRTYTYRELNDAANRMANWAIGAGIGKGSCVSLMKENSPEFVVVWLALSKIGAKTALINHNLTGAPLVNCLKLSTEQSAGEKNVIIFGSECESKLREQEVIDALTEQGAFTFYSYDNVEGTGESETEGSHTWASLDGQLKDYDTSEPSKSLREGVSWKDPLFYIYTSGTTGLPKAATFPHLRFFGGGLVIAMLLKIKKSDSVYCPMPIYHSAGGALGTSIAFNLGLHFVMRKKFSASKYFEDCAKYNVTIGQYIGELCKYLCATPAGDYDKKHKVRMMIGNGLRKDDWLATQERFGVPRFGEFYASTEGNANLINNVNKPGACGYLPWIGRKVYPVKIIKMDPEDEEKPLRNKAGKCIECKANEPGQLIGFINQKDPTRRFDGYTNKEATKKKIITGAFKKNDQWFATGDLLVRDAAGYYYFVDRIGDTFRWKGENCSTREVEEVAEKAADGIAEVNVYGVMINGHGGRAGMAKIGLAEGKTIEDFDFSSFYKNNAKSLAAYQRPLFLRITNDMQTTSTFKHKKVDLRKQGFDPSLVEEPLFFMDAENETYKPLDANLYDDIQNGKIRI